MVKKVKICDLRILELKKKTLLPQFLSNFQKLSIKMFGRTPTFEKNV